MVTSDDLVLSVGEFKVTLQRALEATDDDYALSRCGVEEYLWSGTST